MRVYCKAYGEKGRIASRDELSLEFVRLYCQCISPSYLDIQPHRLPHPEPLRPGSRPLAVRPPAQLVQGPATRPVRSIGHGVLHVITQPCLSSFKAFQLSNAILKQRQFRPLRQLQVTSQHVDQQGKAVSAFFEFFAQFRSADFGIQHNDFSFFGVVSQRILFVPVCGEQPGGVLPGVCEAVRADQRVHRLAGTQ